MMIRLSQYVENGYSDSPVFINQEEIAVVRPWMYHSFRPSIGEVTLRCGTVIRVWETVEQVMAKMRGD